MNGWKRNRPAGVGSTAQALRKTIKTIVTDTGGDVKGKIARCACGALYEPNWDRPHCCKECRDEAAHQLLKAFESMNPSQVEQMEYERDGIGLAGLKELLQGIPVWKEHSHDHKHTH